MDAQLCRMKRPGWAKACYLQGAAQMLLKVRWNIYTFPSTNSFSPPNPYLFFDAVTLISSGLWKGMWCISRWSQTGSSKCWDWQSIVVKSSLSFSEDLFCKYKLSLVSIILSIARIDFIRLCSHLFERLRISLLNYAFICYFVTLRRLPLESPGESCAIKALSVIGVFLLRREAVDCMKASQAAKQLSAVSLAQWHWKLCPGVPELLSARLKTLSVSFWRPQIRVTSRFIMIFCGHGGQHCRCSFFPPTSGALVRPSLLPVSWSSNSRVMTMTSGLDIKGVIGCLA